VGVITKPGEPPLPPPPPPRSGGERFVIGLGKVLLGLLIAAAVGFGLLFAACGGCK
jgi:hypothetical protein